jgi:uncharacterized phage protein (TIGR02220 family)
MDNQTAKRLKLSDGSRPVCQMGTGRDRQRVTMPNRILSPKICESKRVNQLSANAERLYYRLLVNTDDFGRCDGRPMTILTTCFPRWCDDPLFNNLNERLAEIKTWLDELVKVGLILPYDVDGRRFFQFYKWRQRLRSRFAKFPEPPPDVVCRSKLEHDDDTTSTSCPSGDGHGDGQTTDTTSTSCPSGDGHGDGQTTDTMTKSRQHGVCTIRSTSTSTSTSTSKGGSRGDNPSETWKTAKRVLEYLNKQAGRSFKPTKTTLTPIVARLTEGATEQDCRTVIDDRCRRWLRPQKGQRDMSEFIRPSTLFRPTNFAEYLGGATRTEPNYQEGGWK